MAENQWRINLSRCIWSLPELFRGKLTLPESAGLLLRAPRGRQPIRHRTLDMKDTGFSVTDEARLVVPYADGVPRPVRMGPLEIVKAASGPGSIQFAPARAFNRDSYPSGGCGMVGTAEDFRKFLEALRTGGSPILSLESAKAMTTDQTGGLGPGPGTAFGFGLSVITNPEAAQTPHAPGTFTWGGVYGHRWLVNRITVVSSNTAVEAPPGSSGVTFLMPSGTRSGAVCEGKEEYQWMIFVQANARARTGYILPLSGARRRGW